MMTSKKSFCFIPAKAASTRLRKKNILPLGGKEIIYYAINNALQSGLFDTEDVIVSSESEEVQAIARKHGAKTPYTRKEHLAHDPYGVVDVLYDFLQELPHYQEYNSCCILLPTAPLMLPVDIKDAYSIHQDFDAVMSVTETEHNAYRTVLVQEDKLEALFPQYLRKKSQELAKTYRINGAVTWINVQEFMRVKTYFMDSWGAYIMPHERSVDIDNYSDYQYAQFLMDNQE